MKKYINKKVQDYYGLATNQQNIMKQNAIAKAAVRFKGEMSIGLHHGEAMRTLYKKIEGKNLPLPTTIGPEQGFVDIHGIFHTREAARKIAITAGQVNKEPEFSIALDSSEFTDQDEKGKTVWKYKPFIEKK